MRTKFNNRGFTYAEVLFALPIVLLSIFAAVAALIGTRGYSERARHYTNAMNLGIYQLENIRNIATSNNFSTQMTAINGTKFPTAGSQQHVQIIQGFGLQPLDVEVFRYAATVDGDPDLWNVTISVCFKDRGNRTIGEDQNFNGSLDVGEDLNGNGIIDSPIMFRTMVVRK